MVYNISGTEEKVHVTMRRHMCLIQKFGLNCVIGEMSLRYKDWEEVNQVKREDP